MEYAHQIYKRAKKEYDIKSETNLSTLKETIQSVFDSMFHGVKGERIVRVDKKYNVTLPIGNRNLDTSEGTDVVKNFAFIATLLKMAKDYSIGGDGEITSEPMPLVMDAPFSKTDAKHIQNISKEIPRLSQQTIVTMLDIQWKNASKTMGDRVGITYRLDQKSQTHTDIVREV